MKRIYLDNAAATPLDKRVLDTMLPFFGAEFYNPSALYLGARRASESLNNARSSVAKSIGARQSEIVFTAGGSESANLAIQGVSDKFPDSNIIVSSIEHDAVIKSAVSRGAYLAKVSKSGIVDINQLAKLISDNTVLVSVMLINNEVGTIQPIQKLANLISIIKDERRKNNVKLPLYLHTDACQAPLYVDVNVAKLGVDLMTLNGGKIHGPKQSGILYIRSGVLLDPIIMGGGQEFGIRSGTENIAFAVGFAKALELAEKGRKDRAINVSKLRDYFIEKIESTYDAEITGSKKQRIANNVHTIFRGVDNERVLFALDDLGVDAAAGSACSAGSDEPSHVLLAMGYSGEDARSSIRFSLGEKTTKAEIDKVLLILEIALKA